VAVVGAGAAGLMAAIHAARAGARVAVLEGARTPGAKILVSGGGRCNVTHDVVDETSFAGSTRPAIRRVLRRYGVDDVTAFFREQGVALKREETGKLFPVTDRARSVLDALFGAARSAGAEVRHPWRVAAVERAGSGFRVVAATGAALECDRVILATGGRSLPKTGSDGGGYALARALGHTVTRVFPALVPLTVAAGWPLLALSGLAAAARAEVRTATGRRLVGLEGDLLCTHFGLSGPLAMDVSRYLSAARFEDTGAGLAVDWVPGLAEERLDRALRESGPAGPARVLEAHVPERLARALCAAAGVDPATPGHRLPRDARRAVVQAAKAMAVPVTGDRGWNYAEVTAGGVPLAELRLDTMESRATPGLFLCGEICDVDGRIGGYNFQWAWSSGFVSGTAAAR
jgi:predicted Rossmann fold flavoprotein